MIDNRIEAPPTPPEDRTIVYRFVSRHPGRWGGDSWHTVDTLEEAVEIAGGWGGDGSGRIKKVTTWRTWAKEGAVYYTSDHKLEEDLDMKIKFNDEGKKQRERWLAKVTCTHASTRTIRGGAGCQTWDDVICNDCGRQVG